MPTTMPNGTRTRRILMTLTIVALALGLAGLGPTVGEAGATSIKASCLTRSDGGPARAAVVTPAEATPTPSSVRPGTGRLR